jgi:phosphoribosylformylglycinamidine synthase
MVMGDTVQRPGGDAAVVRVHGTRKALAITTDCTPRYCAADAQVGGRQAVAEAWRNLCAVGAEPIALTDNLNFGNPERPEIMGQFVGCIEGMRAACTALDFPVVSGNVSFYNETNGTAVLPTPVIGGVGLIADVGRTATPAFKAPGEKIVLVGGACGHLGCSVYAREVLGRADGAPPPVDLEAERRNGELVRRMITERRVTGAHDLSGGGLMVALAEMAMAGGIGAEIEIAGGAALDSAEAAACAFGEDQGRYLVTTADAEALVAEAAGAGVPAQVIGTTGGDALTLNPGRAISVAVLSEAHEGWLPAYMAAGPGA